MSSPPQGGVHPHVPSSSVPLPPPPSSSTSHHASSAAPGLTSRLYVRYADVEAALAARGYSLIRLLLGVTAGTGLALAASWGRLKQWGAAEGADVATLTLADEQLQAVAAEVGRGVAGGILADEGVRQAVREVLGQAVVELMREAATTLANTLLANPSVIAASSSLAADVVTTPPVLAATANALSVGAVDAVARPVVVDAAREMVVGLVAQEAVRTAAADAAWAVLKVGVFGSGRGARARRAAAAATTPSAESSKGNSGGEGAGKGVSEAATRGLSAAALDEKEQPGGSLVAAGVVT
ncbi:hypothetical protein MMPV_005076 [Pyropia vietnamensis]